VQDFVVPPNKAVTARRRVLVGCKSSPVLLIHECRRLRTS
jgi:hypothetical protein